MYVIIQLICRDNGAVDLATGMVRAEGGEIQGEAGVAIVEEQGPRVGLDEDVHVQAAVIEDVRVPVVVEVVEPDAYQAWVDARTGGEAKLASASQD